MKNILDHSLPIPVRESIKKLGGKIFQVGGAVRDELIGKVVSKDLDIIVTGVDLGSERCS